MSMMCCACACLTVIYTAATTVSYDIIRVVSGYGPMASCGRHSNPVKKCWSLCNTAIMMPHIIQV